MTLRLLLAVLAGLAAPITTTAVEDAERDSVVRALGAYHAALEAGEPERVLDALGPSFFMANEETSKGGAGRLGAHLFLAGESLRAWPEAFLREAGPYRNAFEVQSVSIRGAGAIVVTRDRGSNAFRSWKDEETVWFLGRTDDRWRVVGMVVRDIQLPKRPPADGP